LANDSSSDYTGQEEYVWLVYRRFCEKVALTSLPVILGFAVWKIKF